MISNWFWSISRSISIELIKSRSISQNIESIRSQLIFNLFDLDWYRINIELIGFYWPLSIEFIIEFQVLTRENTISGAWTCLSVDKRIPGAEGRAPSTPSRLTRSRRPSASRSTDTWETMHGAFLCNMWMNRKRIRNG